MTLLIAVIIIVLALQVLIFIVTRRKIKKEREHNVIMKYNIKTSGDAWRLINNQQIPQEDRDKIEGIYKGSDEVN